MEKPLKKITFNQLNKLVNQWMESHPNASQFDKAPIAGIVFKSSNWKEDFSLEFRTYEAVITQNYWLHNNRRGSSLFATNLDKTDVNINLTHYLGSWKIDYCYLKDNE